MCGAARAALVAVCLLAQVCYSEAACTAGFTVYSDASLWVEALKTASGKHCLEGSEAERISIQGVRLELAGEIMAEAHYVDFADNSEEEWGELGGLVVVKMGSRFACFSCTFTNGKATSGIGGAVYIGEEGEGGLTGAEFACTNCTFEGNEALSGGVAYIDGGFFFTCTNCLFKANSATEPERGFGGQGGAVFNNNCWPSPCNSVGGTFFCDTCVFDGNVAWSDRTQSGGGAVFNGYNANLTLIDPIFRTLGDTVVEGNAPFDLMGLLTLLGGILACCCCCGIVACGAFFFMQRGNPAPTPAVQPQQQQQLVAPQQQQGQVKPAPQYQV